MYDSNKNMDITISDWVLFIRNAFTYMSYTYEGICKYFKLERYNW